jgi:glycosyltransferase involved in cell wall biosynthesis
MISVALCTRDGSEFLAAQLDSLLAQKCPPAELVVCDDASADDTVATVEEFGRRAPFPVQVYRNKQRLGVGANFEQAIRLCAGDLIVLCDQDDVWRADKLARLRAALDLSTSSVAAFSDALVVDSHLHSLGYTMWQQANFTHQRQKLIQSDKPWDVLFKDPVVTGATLMFRRDLLPFILPIPASWVHDAWIAQIAGSQGPIVCIPQPLVLYRQHKNNVIGGRKVTFRDQMARARGLTRLGLLEREINRYSALRDRLTDFSASERRDVMLAKCNAKLRHLRCRQRLPTSRPCRVATVMREWANGNYRRFAKDWRNVAADLLMR